MTFWLLTHQSITTLRLDHGNSTLINYSTYNALKELQWYMCGDLNEIGSQRGSYV